MWPLLYLPKGITRNEKFDYGTGDLGLLFRELASQNFSGYVEIASPVQRGFFGWHKGNLHTVFYDGDDGRELFREEILRHFLLKEKRSAETVVNVTELDPRLAEATGLLASKPPLYRELETGFIDMNRLFDTLAAKRFVGVLRFYHIRSHTRLGNILVKMNKITRDQLQQAVRLQLSHQGALRLGDALVQIGAIAPADLGNALDLQSHARKGSDIELALAVFYEGEFLGGYTHIHKQFKTGREEILPQLVGTEVLMDILEGGLPEPLELTALLKSPEQPAPAAAGKMPPPAASRATVPPEKPNPFSDEGFNLKAEDLVLDLRPLSASDEDSFLTLTEADDFEETAPVSPLPAETVIPAAKEIQTEPKVPEPAEVSSGVGEPEPAPVKQLPVERAAPSEEAGAAAPESRGMDYVLEVARAYLGPLGKSLLKKEAAPLALQGRDWPEAQVRELVLRFCRSARWLVGRRRSESLLEKIRERIEI